MKYAHLAEQDYSHAATLALTDLRPQFFEEGFDVSPLDVRAGRMREDCFKCALVLALHNVMVPRMGTIKKGSGLLTANV